MGVGQEVRKVHQFFILYFLFTVVRKPRSYIQAGMWFLLDTDLQLQTNEKGCFVLRAEGRTLREYGYNKGAAKQQDIWTIDRRS